MKQFGGHGRQVQRGFQFMLTFLNFRVFAWAFGPQYMCVTVWITDTWKGSNGEHTQGHTHTHRQCIWLLTSQIPRFWPRIKRCSFQGSPYWGFNMTAALISCLHGSNKSASPKIYQRHNILKQKLSGRYVECKGCPKESTILINPSEASKFSKSARKKWHCWLKKHRTVEAQRVWTTSISHTSHQSQTIPCRVAHDIKDYEITKETQDDEFVKPKFWLILFSWHTHKHTHIHLVLAFLLNMPQGIWISSTDITI